MVYFLKDNIPDLHNFKDNDLTGQNLKENDSDRL